MKTVKNREDLIRLASERGASAVFKTGQVINADGARSYVRGRPRAEPAPPPAPAPEPAPPPAAEPAPEVRVVVDMAPVNEAMGAIAEQNRKVAEAIGVILARAPEPPAPAVRPKKYVFEITRDSAGLMSSVTATEV